MTVSVKQHEHDWVTLCTFSVDFKEDITIVAQHMRDLFTTAIERPSQRRDRNASATWSCEFSNKNLDIFPRCMPYKTGTYEMTHTSAQRYLKMVFWICPASINRGWRSLHYDLKQLENLEQPCHDSQHVENHHSVYTSISVLVTINTPRVEDNTTCVCLFMKST